MALTFQNAWFLRTPVVIQAKDINTDPSYSGTTDSYVALGNSLGSDITMAHVAAQVTQITTAPVAAACHLDTNMVSRG